MKQIPEIKSGDLIKVYTKIVEGGKERVTPFQGIIIQTKGSGISKTITVRKISAGIGIERIFPLHSPIITKIEVKKRGKVRRAKLGYLRYMKGKKLKSKTREIKKPDREAKKEASSIEFPHRQEAVEKT